ncbi:amidase signature domain-containing protein [Boeremia exigua]|uniref:amidase signature domain-containing protein n=1 Tax=Boeremia exigua TaxID=749465 RepID=UPI001E8CE190|nr:amidase signature domain-containing protein [Boeremia exigua]KAH6625931.1 amidase signature domain-containing protein [Boeremia exigua]
MSAFIVTDTIEGSREQEGGHSNRTWSVISAMQKLAAGKLSSLLNCSLKFFPKLALKRARELDVYFKVNKCTVGPLYGLLGLETTMGYVDWIRKYNQEESVLVTILRKARAVFYVKTSVLQSLMVYKTVNNIIGWTINPYNRNWSCGGSSSSKGALVRFYSALISVGTDIANSIAGQETVHSVCGPMAHNQYNSKVIPMPWRPNKETIIKSKISSNDLILAFYIMQLVVDALKQAGYTIVPWKPYKHQYAVELINRIYASDGGDDVYATLKASGEPAITNFSDLIDLTLPKLDTDKIWDANLDRWQYQMEYLDQIRAFEEENHRELDAIIALITPTAAIRHDQFRYYGYASVINLLDFTSVVVPVTFANKNVDVKDENFKQLTNMDGVMQAEYDLDVYHGAPVAVQIIGRRLSKEKVLMIAAEIIRVSGSLCQDHTKPLPYYAMP